MASSHILISGSATPHNAQLRSHIDALQRLINESNRIKAVFDSASLGSDWTGLGELLGVSAEDAEVVYNLFVGVKNEMDGDLSIPQYLSRLG
jgi:hypothetical protein